MAEWENPEGDSSEWYTPPEIFQALKLKFDLDPCYPSTRQRHCCVPARLCFMPPMNGLEMKWRGLVFMNPPFGGRYGHVPWLKKFLDHGNGVAIVRAYTSSDWWHEHVAPRAETLVFPKGKTKFVRPDGTIGKAPGHGIALLGMGKIASRALECSGLGWVVRNKLLR